ncbi:hypothetical protein A3Q56_07489 [Intoshia linei]|uniref:Uncharacterized protein n=1 Tax=Intoshia linei TaxID=1819745 RepID=A0A177AS23_9BILA|nr:hypothetical protein A3Q56_07489 [Intoshia linei]
MAIKTAVNSINNNLKNTERKPIRINKGTSTPYCHQETGKVERLHRNIKEKLRIMCNEEGSN